MRLILVLNGYENNYLQVHGFSKEDTKILKYDEKKLAAPSEIIKMINNNSVSEFYVASRELGLQRFKTFIKLYILLSKAKSGGIIDEYGNKDKYSLSKLIINELPMLFIEILVSVLVVVYSYIKFPLMKWILKKKI
jgi:hypothetical protein